MAKRVSARETAFLKPKCAMKAGVHFDQMKVSERRTESKKTKWGISHNQKENSSVPHNQK